MAGVLANYTYVQGSREAHSAGALNAIPGTSKHSVNFSVYYQQPLFDVRLASITTGPAMPPA